MSDLIAAYLFLGGAGSGAFFVAAFATWLNGRRFRRGCNAVKPALVNQTAEKVYIAAFLLLALGALCLLLDLERPDRAHLLFFMPNATYITLGAYVLAALLVCSLVLAVQPYVSRGRVALALSSACKLVGSAASLVVMAYTGLLLRSMGGVPLWDSLLLPVLFVCSSLASGVAVMLICAALSHDLVSARSGLERSLAKADLVLTLAQAVACIVYLINVSSDPLGLASVEDMLFGDWTAPFVGGYAILGLLAPTAIDIAAIRGRQAPWGGVASAAAILAGCLCLRLCLVGAGIHTTVSGIGF